MRHNFIVSIMAALILSASCALQSCSVDGSDGQSRILKIYDSWFYARSCSSADENSLLDGEPYNGCQRVSLPHYVNPPADSSFNSYYLRKFFVPPYMDGKRVSLHFGGVTSNACVWLNGELLADSLEPYKPFALDIKPRKGENCVLLKLDKGGMMHSGAYICGSDSLCFTFADEFIEGNSDIAVRTFNIEGGNGSVAFCASIRNSYSSSRKARIDYRILDHNGKCLAYGHVKSIAEPGAFIDLSDTVDMSGITLWDIDNPWIYTLELLLSCDGDLVDKRLVNFGFRNLEVAAGHVSINGKERHLMGANVRHRYPYVGPAVSSEALWRDAYRIKRGGFDFVNVSDFPHPHQFLCACDQYGIIVLDTCSDSRGRARQNHPCILSLPDSRGVNVYGKAALARREDSESEMIQQVHDLASMRQASCKDSCFADALCNFFDTDYAHCNGVMSSARLPKLSYYLFQSQRDIDETDLQAFAEPFCKLLSRWEPGQSRGVEVCTNCGSVELWVDGVSQGRKLVQYSGNMLHPTVKFDAVCAKPGSIKAIAYIGNVPKAEDVVSTPGDPVRLKIIIDERGTLVSDNDILLVHCYILDNDGNTVSQCSDAVQFAVTGTASLLSPTSVNAKAGVASCLVRTGNSANDFTISATCGLMYTVADK